MLAAHCTLLMMTFVVLITFLILHFFELNLLR